MATAQQLKLLLKGSTRLSDAQVAAFTATLQRFLGRALTDIIDGLEEGNVGAREAASVLGSMLSTLRSQGLTEELGKIEAMYATDIGYMRRLFNELGKGQVFSEADLSTIETIVQFDLNAIGANVESYISDLRSEVMRTVVTGDRENWDDLIERTVDRAGHAIETDLNTSLSGFKRTLTLSKAKELDFTHYLYEGPDDDVTRPFCQERVGQIFTLEEIARWDNGQGLPADVYLGGYNCRHQLLPIDEETAKGLGLEI